jgi:hypothetical protein
VRGISWHGELIGGRRERLNRYTSRGRRTIPFSDAAIWQEEVCRASEALDSFLENWWLQRMNAATSDLAFIYKLV